MCIVVGDSISLSVQALSVSMRLIGKGAVPRGRGRSRYLVRSLCVCVVAEGAGRSSGRGSSLAVSTWAEMRCTKLPLVPPGDVRRCLQQGLVCASMAQWAYHLVIAALAPW